MQSCTHALHMRDRINKNLNTWLKNLKAIDEKLTGNRESLGITKSQSSWISVQRSRLKKGELSTFQRKEFSKLNKKLTEYGNLPAAKRKLNWAKVWHVKAEQIILFRNNNGRWPSEIAKDKTGRHLGLWKKKLRMYYQAGKLPEALVEFLRTAGFYLEGKKSWRQKYDELKKYIKEHGHMPLEGHDLHDWVNQLSAKYDKLDPEKKELLNGISFLSVTTAVEQKRIDNWNRDFRGVKAYFDKYGKLPTRRDKGEDKTLRYWMEKQRTKLKAGEMPENELKLLRQNGIDLLSGTFTIPLWEDVLNDLKKFLKRNKGRWPSVPLKDDKERKLYSWCLTQRGKYKTGKLSPEKIRCLNELNFSWGETRNPKIIADR